VLHQDLYVLVSQKLACLHIQTRSGLRWRPYFSSQSELFESFFKLFWLDG